MSTLAALIVPALFCALLVAGFCIGYALTGLIRAYERRPKPEPSPRDYDVWGDYPSDHDIEEARGRE